MALMLRNAHTYVSCLVQAIADACAYAIVVHGFPRAHVTFLSIHIYIPMRDRHVRIHVHTYLRIIVRMQPGLGCLALMCSAVFSSVPWRAEANYLMASVSMRMAGRKRTKCISMRQMKVRVAKWRLHVCLV